MTMMPQTAWEWIAGASAGLGLFAVNTWLWKTIVAALVKKTPVKKARMAVLAFVKLGLNFAMVALSLVVVGLNPIAFLVGLTIGIVGLVSRGL